MAYCTNCGTNNPDSASFCSSCGQPLKAHQPQQQAVFNGQSVMNYGTVERYNTTGLMVWSIICLFLCLIAGIIALVNVTKINKAATFEEQQRKIKNTKIACTVGTVIGVLAVIGQFAQAGMM